MPEDTEDLSKEPPGYRLDDSVQFVRDPKDWVVEIPLGLSPKAKEEEVSAATNMLSIGDNEEVARNFPAALNTLSVRELQILQSVSLGRLGETGNFVEKKVDDDSISHFLRDFFQWSATSLKLANLQSEISGKDIYKKLGDALFDRISFLRSALKGIEEKDYQKVNVFFDFEESLARESDTSGSLASDFFDLPLARTYKYDKVRAYLLERITKR